MMSYHAAPLSPYHQTPPLKPVSYIPATSAAIPKPTPISMVTHAPTKNPISRVMSGGSGPTTDKQVKGEGLGSLLPQQYQSCGRYPNIQGGGEVVNSSLGKILSTSSSQLLTMPSSAGTAMGVV